MAQNDGQVTYQIKMLMDDAGAVASMNQHFDRMRKKLAQARNTLAKTDDAAELLTTSASDVATAFNRAPKAVTNLRQKIIQSDTALEEMAATARGAWGRVSQGALMASEGTQKLRTDIIQTAEASETMAQQSRRMGNQVGRTSATSQSLLRIIQDSRFGMLGMANNMQRLAETMGQATARGTSAFAQLRAGIKGLITGPFAIPFAITLMTTLAQVDFSDLIESVSGLDETFNNWITSITRAEEALRSLREESEELLKVEFKDVLEDLSAISGEQLPEAFRITNQEARKLRSELEKVDKQIRNNFTKDEFEGVRSLLRSPAGPDQASDFATEQARQLATLIDRRDTLQAQLKQISTLNRVINDENTKFNKKARTLAEEIQPLNVKQAKELLRLSGERKEEQEDKNEFLLEELRIRKEIVNEMQDARFDRLEEEGMPLLAATERINEEFGRRKEEIKQKYAEQRKTVKEELNKGSERRQELLAEIGQRESEAIAALEDRRQQKLRNTIDEIRRERAQEGLIEAGDVDFDVQDHVLMNGSFVPRSKALDVARDALKRRDKAIEAARDELDAERDMGPGAGFFDQTGTTASQQFQMRMLEREKALRKRRIESEKQFQNRRAELHEPGSPAWTDAVSNMIALEQKKHEVEERWQRKRIQQQKEFLRQKVENLESSQIGSATSNLIMELGGMWESFRSEDIKLSEMHAKEKAQLFSSMGSRLLAATDDVATGIFETWKENRKRELENQGKTQEEQRRMLREEGKKRFQMMKAIKYASAAVSGIEAQIHAWTKGMEMGGPPLAIAMSAASAAKTAFMLKKIAGMSIGDRISGAGASGGGRTGEFTQFSATQSARRAADFGTGRRRQRNNNQQRAIEDTARRVGQEVARAMPEEVTMGRKTAAEAARVGKQTNTKFNK